MSEYVQVITTTASEEEARRMARALVERALAACVQVIGPISSVYRWQGAVEEDEEWLCLIKSTRARYERIEAAILALHSYETPEILAVPVVEGCADYLRWLDAAVEERGDV
ncbi:MAG: divalent-cation tolerance protein CutA [Anaerolineae bacterium]